jgi:hypothetical protein
MMKRNIGFEIETGSSSLSTKYPVEVVCGLLWSCPGLFYSLAMFGFLAETELHAWSGRCFPMVDLGFESQRISYKPLCRLGI